jgi:hypothetical protein
MQYFFILRLLLTVAAHPTPSAHHQEADTNAGMFALGLGCALEEA